MVVSGPEGLDVAGHGTGSGQWSMVNCLLTNQSFILFLISSLHVFYLLLLLLGALRYPTTYLADGEGGGERGGESQSFLRPTDLVYFLFQKIENDF